MTEHDQGGGIRAGQLAALERVPFFDLAARDFFDRVTRLASALLDVPVALVNLVDGDDLLFSSCVGPGPVWAETPGVPLGHAACQFAILSNEPLAIADARVDERLRSSPAVGALGLVGYLGVPLQTKDGVTIGTLCVISDAPREWADGDVQELSDLGALVTAYLDARPAQGSTGGGLNIAAVAKRTGIGADTLRKWERRYGVLRPSRTAGGQRRYDERDVARVEWLRDRLAEGFRIGEAAALLASDEPVAATTPEELREEIVGAVLGGELRRLPALVDHAFTLHDVDVALEEVIAGALRTVGDSWREGAHRIADEHLLSELAQRRLRSLLDDRRHAVRGTVVLACAPGERHELGLLALAVLLQADGWLAVYLGAETPLASALDAVRRTAAQTLCLSAATAERYAELESELAAADLPPELVVHVGGAGVENERPLRETVAALRGGALMPRA